jgi:hypothetical protein
VLEGNGGIRRSHTHTLTAQGHGTVFEDNGDTYEGDFLYGQKHGRGRAVYGGRPVDGFGADVYEGHFENDLK